MFKEKKFSKNLILLFVFVFLAFTLSQFLSYNFNTKTETELIKLNALSATSEFSDSFEGEGTATDPYLLSDYYDLTNLRIRVNSGTTYVDQYFILTNNITLPSNVWQPIGNASYTFRGIFDGNGYSISNLILSSTNTRNGLFGAIRNAKIVNLQLKNISITGTINSDVCLGSLVGTADGDCTLSNIIVTNSRLSMSVSGSGSLIVGGLVGYSSATNLRIRNCVLSGNTFLTSLHPIIYSGGFIGWAVKNEPGVIIEECKSKGYEFIDADLNENLIIRRSFYSLGSAFTWYGYDNKNGVYPTYNVNTAFEGLDNFTPNTWYIDGNDIHIRGVGNVNFTINSSNADLSNDFPTSLGTNRKLTITANTEFIINSATFYQNVYENTWLYISSDYPILKANVQLGYLYKANDSRTLDFYTTEVLGTLANRQGNFIVDLNLTQNIVSVPIVERYFDIASNSWVQLGTKNLDLTRNENINQSIIQEADSETQIDYSNYNYLYLNEITPNYYEFTKLGATSVLITAENFVFTAEHINLIISGYVLNINYTNGFLFNTQLTAFDSENYWISSTNSTLYQMTDNIFSAVSLNASSPLIVENLDYDFIGWSSTNSDVPLDFYGRVDDLSFVPWKSDYTIQILANRANLTELNNDYTITGLTTSEFSEWDFTNSTSSNLLTLYPIWGGNTVRLYTYVYSYFGGTYHLKSTLYVDSTATHIADFYRLDNDDSCTLTLKNANGTVLDLSNGGYLNVEWFVAEIRENAIYYLSENEGEGFGSIAVDDMSATATFSGMTRQTSVIVVLTPLENIGINLEITGIEIEHNIYFKINDIIFEYETTKLIYGEEYVITIHNMPSGYHVAYVEITNDIITNISYNGRDKTCTFTVNFVDEIELTFTLAEGLLKELFIFIIASMLIIALIIITLLIIGNSIRRKNPDNITGIKSKDIKK
ncbi:MAG: hypothetical protein PHR96_02795 [Clostridia bacterium]|nr:hypothetical protein [Clostridia bacterium]